MLDRLQNVKCKSLDEFKKVLVRIWNEIPIEVVRASCDNFVKRCRRCIKVKGERFEMD